MKIQQAIDQFNLNIASVKQLYGIYTVHSSLTSSIDASEVLRAVVVMTVSALDCYLHELVAWGTVDIYSGVAKFGYGNATLKPSESTPWLLHKLSIDKSAQLNEIENEIWKKIESKTFQDPEIIQSNLACLGVNDVWNRVSGTMSINEQDLKNRLKLIVNRRNSIAHEADIDRTSSLLGVKRAISPTDVWDDILFIELLGETIHSLYI